MVDVSSFKYDDKVSADWVKRFGRDGAECAIVDEGEIRVFSDGDKLVLSLSHAGGVLDWMPNQTCVNVIGRVLGSFDTKDWVGCVVSLFWDKSLGPAGGVNVVVLRDAAGRGLGV